LATLASELSANVTDTPRNGDDVPLGQQVDTVSASQRRAAAVGVLSLFVAAAFVLILVAVSR
jgi:hypothetical protein